MRHPVLANNILQARKELGRRLGHKVTQQAVANAADMPLRVYERHERGEIDMMVSTLLKIADGLRTTPEALMRGVDRASSVEDGGP